MIAIERFDVEFVPKEPAWGNLGEFNQRKEVRFPPSIPEKYVLY